MGRKPVGGAGLRVAGVVDIECANWDRFVCGQILTRTGERFTSWDESAFFAALAAREGCFYTWAGGRYDILWAIDCAVRHGMPWSARMRGSGVLSATLGKLEMRDAFALVPMSLAKAAPLAGRDLGKLAFPLACECSKRCEGYCVLARPLSPAERAKVEEYLDRDCDVTLAVLDALESRCVALDIRLTLTVGGSAWKTAKKWLDLPSASHSLARYSKIREGYYGGRVEVFRPRAPSGHRYDIHSSYPAALSRTALPVGPSTFLDGSLAASHFASGRAGIFGADVIVPDCYVPPLPVRQTERLIYPIGPLSGVWTGIELRRAVDCGASVERVRWCFGWRHEEKVLAPFAERVWQHRDAAMREGTASGDAWGAWFKWLANSCTGKFAQRPEHAQLHFAPLLASGAPPMLEHDTVVIGNRDGGVYYRTMRSGVDACAHVEWAAHLTADARASELLAQLHAASEPLYCDTDSVYSVGEQTRRIGDGLGEWGYEGALSDWQALAPKIYRYFDGAKWKVKGKGLSGLTSEGFDALAKGDAWTVDRGVEGLRSALAKGGRLFRARSLTRSLAPVDGWVGGRILDGSNDTRPPTVAEYQAAQPARSRAKSKRKKP